MASKRRRPVLYELVRRTPPRETGPRRATPPPASAPAAAQPEQPVSRPATNGPLPGSPRPAPPPPPPKREPAAAVATSASAGGAGSVAARPLYLPPRRDDALGPRLLRALGSWRQRVQSAPPWATVIGLLVAIAFLVLVSYQLYRAFAVSDPAADGAGHAPPAQPQPENPLTPPRREALLPTIGDPERTATPPRDDAGLRPDIGRNDREPSGPVSTDAPRPAEAPAPPGDLPAPTVSFQKGKHYLHIQHFPKKARQAALAAHAFVNAQGIKASLIDAPAELRLVADEPFSIDQKDRRAGAAEKRRCEDLKKRVRDIGRQYAKQAGYFFDQAFERRY